MNQLVDNYGRKHRDLRVSLTDRCNVRCTYCMPEDFGQWIASEHLLTAPEMLRVIDIATRCGIAEVRLTGGEPLLRTDIVEIVRGINALERAPKLSLTTNGIRLAELAAPLRDAGLVRVNISLDTLDPETYKALTKRDRFHDVVKGIKSARDAGLSPIKINAVLMPGINDGEAVDLLRWALDEGYSLRFIEQMPLDAGGIWSRSTMVTAEQIQEALSQHFDLNPVATRGSAPAEEFLVNGGPWTVGIIASVTRPFCGSCDRLRLTADGQLRSCLFSQTETDLRSMLRSQISLQDQQAGIEALFEKTVAAKLPGHGINDPSFISPTRPMSAIGG